LEQRLNNPTAPSKH